MKRINYLCYIIIVLTLISTTVGIFYSTGGDRLTVENIYGESIELYGDGIYKYDSVLKAGGNKGTDLVMLIVLFLFFFFTIKKEKSTKYRVLHIGLLSGLVYYSACLVFSVTFNRLFLIYVLLFSSSFFALIFLLSELFKENNMPKNIISKSFIGTALFLIISGSSVLVWLEFIIPALVNGQPLSIIGVYTTEPTFVLDLGIVLPVYFGCGIALLKKKEISYNLAPVLLTFITIVGLTVIGQNIFQSYIGVEIPIRQLLGLVISFAVLGAVAIILNMRFLKHLKA